MSISTNKRCWAVIDLAALERNLGKIRASISSDIQYISVVKADAYGHGLPKVVPHLMASFVDMFAVANVQEAATIREIGSGWPILVLSPILPEEEAMVLEYDLTITLSHEDELARFEHLGKTQEAVIQVHMKIDTGMGRSGVWHEEALGLYEKIQASPCINLKGIYTHFASADTDKAYTAKQRKHFSDFLDLIDTEDLVIHLDNSAGVETMDSESGVNAVRIGVLQYGILPARDSRLSHLGLDPILSLYSRVGLIKHLPKDTLISYRGTHSLKRDSKIAIVTAGYGDGLPMGLSNQGQVIIHGQKFPVLGRVTMDQLIIDITEANKPIAVGDNVTLLGQDGEEFIRISEWSRWAGTNEWDVYCSINKRVPRNYLNAITA